jgi:hypothetical protein
MNSRKKNIKIAVIVCIFIGMIFVFNHNVFADEELPKFIKIETIPDGNGWIRLPKNTGELKINLVTENAKAVRIWLMPTGTHTINQRELIGELIGNQNVWEYTWRYKGLDTIHHHVRIELIGKRSASVMQTINITSI